VRMLQSYTVPADPCHRSTIHLHKATKPRRQRGSNCMTPRLGSHSRSPNGIRCADPATAGASHNGPPAVTNYSVLKAPTVPPGRPERLKIHAGFRRLAFGVACLGTWAAEVDALASRTPSPSFAQFKRLPTARSTYTCMYVRAGPQMYTCLAKRIMENMQVETGVGRPLIGD